MTENKIKVVGKLNLKGSLDIAKRVYHPNYISPCLNHHAGDTVPKIILQGINNDRE